MKNHENAAPARAPAMISKIQDWGAGAGAGEGVVFPPGLANAEMAFPTGITVGVTFESAPYGGCSQAAPGHRQVFARSSPGPREVIARSSPGHRQGSAAGPGGASGAASVPYGDCLCCC